MGRIYEDVELCGRLRCKKQKGLLDTGSDYVFLSPKLAKELGVEYTKNEFDVRVGEGLEVYAKEAELKDIKLVGVHKYKPRVMVADVGEDLIIGHPLMQMLNLWLNPRSHKVVIDRGKSYLRL
jgi:predicted aspartyl protease